MFQPSSDTKNILPISNPSVTQNSEPSNSNWQNWAKWGITSAGGLVLTTAALYYGGPVLWAGLSTLIAGASRFSKDSQSTTLSQMDQQTASIMNLPNDVPSAKIEYPPHLNEYLETKSDQRTFLKELEAYSQMKETQVFFEGLRDNDQPMAEANKDDEDEDLSKHLPKTITKKQIEKGLKLAEHEELPLHDSQKSFLPEVNEFSNLDDTNGVKFIGGRDRTDSTAQGDDRISVADDNNLLVTEFAKSGQIGTGELLGRVHMASTRDTLELTEFREFSESDFLHNGCDLSKLIHDTDETKYNLGQEFRIKSPTRNTETYQDMTLTNFDEGRIFTIYTRYDDNRIASHFCEVYKLDSNEKTSAVTGHGKDPILWKNPELENTDSNLTKSVYYMVHLHDRIGAFLREDHYNDNASIEGNQIKFNDDNLTFNSEICISGLKLGADGNDTLGNKIVGKSTIVKVDDNKVIYIYMYSKGNQSFLGGKLCNFSPCPDNAATSYNLFGGEVTLNTSDEFPFNPVSKFDKENVNPLNSSEVLSRIHPAITLLNNKKIAIIVNIWKDTSDKKYERISGYIYNFTDNSYLSKTSESELVFDTEDFGCIDAIKTTGLDNGNLVIAIKNRNKGVDNCLSNNPGTAPFLKIYLCGKENFKCEPGFTKLLDRITYNSVKFSIDKLSDGKFIVVWDDNSSGIIYGQVFKNEDDKIEKVGDLKENKCYGYDSSVLSLNDDNFVLVWKTYYQEMDYIIGRVCNIKKCVAVPLSPGAIAGIVIGSVLGTGALAAAGGFFAKKYWDRRKLMAEEKRVQEEHELQPMDVDQIKSTRVSRRSGFFPAQDASTQVSVQIPEATSPQENEISLTTV